jgi:hypothetical protein
MSRVPVPGGIYDIFSNAKSYTSNDRICLHQSKYNDRFDNGFVGHDGKLPCLGIWPFRFLIPSGMLVRGYNCTTYNQPDFVSLHWEILILILLGSEA